MTKNASVDGKATEALFGKLCIESPLYSWGDLDEADAIYYLFNWPLQFDAHCIYCDKPSSFRAMPTLKDQNKVANPELLTFFHATMTCVRVSHTYRYEFMMSANKLSKIGQYPSQETIASTDVERFRPVMDKLTFAELRKAGGLASHGVNIGAFVYLRRIFERLIYSHRELLELGGTKIEGFGTLRMVEKIQALKSVLPPMVVEYKQAYGILSKGIHELDEATCGTYFPVVRAAIIAILEQDLQEKAKADAQAALKAEMARIVGEIKNGAAEA